MVSLRTLFSSIGVTSSEISLLDVAQQFDLGSSFSVTELIQAAGGSPDPKNKNFAILPMEIEGSGDYRADRLRIYFSLADFSNSISISGSLQEFGQFFPQFFNGHGSKVDGHGLKKNIAETSYIPNRPFNGEPTLQFILDARVLFKFVNVPDLHDDWVGFVHQDSSSFAVQTLKRKFTGANDIAFQNLVQNTLIALGLVGFAAGFSAGRLNRIHFLAGRRSWLFGRLPPIVPKSEITGAILPGEANYFFLETATFNRFSSWVVNLASVTGQVGLGDVDKQTIEVWSMLLENFVHFKGFEVGESSRARITTREEPVSFGNTHGNVRFDQGIFPNKQALLAQDWVQEIVKLHPALAQML